MPHFIFCILLGGLLFFQCAFSAFAQNQFCAVLRLRNAPQFEDQDKLSALAVGDFNGDGRPDLALTLNDTVRQNYAVLIRLNNGAGGFNAPLTFTVEANPLAIAAGDFNGDGRADLVVAHRASGEFLRFYQGQGNGTSTAGAQLAIAQPQDIAAITSVDLTGDGRPELMVQSDNFRDENQVITPFVNVLRNNGSGGFSAVARIEGKGTIAADFNGDGRPDLALTRGDALRVLAGRGDATFSAELNQFVPLREMQHSLTAGDFNGDGKMDVAATTSTNGGQVVILPGNGAGDFTERITVTDVRVSVQLVRAVRAAGRTDLVVADESATTYLLNNGSAQFRRIDTVLAPGLREMVAADFNGDGRDDVVTLNQTVTLLLNNGSGGFTDAPLVTEPRNTFFKIALGELNNDGRDDLAALEAPNQLTILRGDGAGRFARARQFTLGENPTDVLIADFNRDGRRDVAALNSAGLAVFLGTSAGELGAATTFNAGPDPLNFTALDYDADGRPDLVVTLNNQSNVSLMRGNGNGGFDAPRTLARPANSREIISADFNGDGRGDLLVASSNDRAYALTSNGDGSFTERGSYDIGSGARKLALGDFNGDGRADVAIGSTTASSAASDIVVLFGNGVGGNGTFTPAPRIEWGNNHAPLAVADLNSDGRSDLVLSNVRESLLLLTGDGTGRFPFNFDRDGLAFPRSYFALGGAINDLVGKDLNGDGFPDFVLAGRGLTVLFGGCLRTATPLVAVSAASYTASLASEMIGAAFSTNLATGIASGGTNPLPTNLVGTSGTVFDSAGVLRPLPLFYVSPAQVNFLMPRDVALGNAELRITSGDGAYAVGNVTIANTAPGIFTANGNGRGVAAGLALRVRNNGSQVFEPILQFNGSSFVPLPIDLGPENEPVFLVLFGTGFRNRGNAPVTVTIGGTNADVTFAGVQGTLIGLDQINVRLPRSLIGRGVLNVAVMVGNQLTNTVQIQIK